jgi:transketolase N-terminal domain/subunit
VTVPPPTGPGLRLLATAIRLRAVAMVAPQGFGYLGQALSAAEQYAAVYGAAYRHGTDRVVCSPGHYVIAAYAAAAQTGLIDEAALTGYGQNGSPVEAIGTERSPVPEYACGSLGQGLSAAAGFALGDRMLGREDARTFAFVSDGELQEGQVWEAAMFAGHHRLARLTVLLDGARGGCPGHPAAGAHLPDLDPARARLPATRCRRALHQAARGACRRSDRGTSGRGRPPHTGTGRRCLTAPGRPCSARRTGPR